MIELAEALGFVASGPALAFFVVLGQFLEATVGVALGQLAALDDFLHVGGMCVCCNARGGLRLAAIVGVSLRCARFLEIRGWSRVRWSEVLASGHDFGTPLRVPHFTRLQARYSAEDDCMHVNV